MAPIQFTLHGVCNTYANTDTNMHMHATAMIEVSILPVTICDHAHDIWGGVMQLSASNSLYTIKLVHGRRLIVQ